LTAHVSETISVKNIADRAHGYGIPGVVVDGNDVLAVYKTTGRAVEMARAQKGPTLIEAKTYRLSGGWGSSDRGGYWDPRLLAKWKKKDPLIMFRHELVKKRKVATEEEIKSILTAAEKLADEAVDFAAKSPYPPPEALFEGLYVDM
jgi:TPP-dependent pyruvate/acetoin dehydrogenase alpha subunit